MRQSRRRAEPLRLARPRGDRAEQAGTAMACGAGVAHRRKAKTLPATEARPRLGGQSLMSGKTPSKAGCCIQSRVTPTSRASAASAPSNDADPIGARNA